MVFIQLVKYVKLDQVFDCLVKGFGECCILTEVLACRFFVDALQVYIVVSTLVCFDA